MGKESVNGVRNVVKSAHSMTVMLVHECDMQGKNTRAALFLGWRRMSIQYVIGDCEQEQSDDNYRKRDVIVWVVVQKPLITKTNAYRFSVVQTHRHWSTEMLR